MFTNAGFVWSHANVEDSDDLVLQCQPYEYRRVKNGKPPCSLNIKSI